MNENFVHEIARFEQSPADNRYTDQKKWKEVVKFMKKNPQIMIDLMPNEEEKSRGSSQAQQKKISRN